MGESFADLLERLCEIMAREYRCEPDRKAALLEETADIVKTMLAKLRDRLDP